MIQKKIINRLFILGDSLCDQGTLVKATNDILSKTSLELKKQLQIIDVTNLEIFSPYDKFSLCNGLIFTHQLSYLLNVEIIPGWEYNFSNIYSFQIGTNYACIGARIEKPSFKNGLGWLIFNHFTLQEQIDALTKHHQILFNDVIIINIGTNDIIFNQEKNARSFIERLIEKLYYCLIFLIKKNATKIIINNLIDLSKTPRFSNNLNQAKYIYDLTTLFNQKLAEMINKINIEFNQLIYLFDIFTFIKNLSQEFLALNSNHKLESENRINLKTMINIGKISLQKNINYDLQHYFFIDDIHFNSWVHKKISNQYQKIIDSLLK